MKRGCGSGISTLKILCFSRTGRHKININKDKQKDAKGFPV